MKQILVVLALASASFCSDLKPAYLILPLETKTIDSTRIELVRESLESGVSPIDSVTVVERARLRDVVEALQFSQSDLVSQDRIIEMGKLVQASHLITGKVDSLNGSWYIYLRRVSVEQGVVEKKSEFSVRCSYDKLIKNIMPVLAHNIATTNADLPMPKKDWEADFTEKSTHSGSSLGNKLDEVGEEFEGFEKKSSSKK